jgi:hypothetical protein
VPLATREEHDARAVPLATREERRVTADEQRPPVGTGGHRPPVGGGTFGRPDANRIALGAVRAILDAAHAFRLEVEGTTVEVVPSRLPSEPWPAQGILGLDESVDGPLPAAVVLDCTWADGRTRLTVSCARWRNEEYRDRIAIQIRVTETRRDLVWVAPSLNVLQTRDGETATVWAACSTFSRKSEETAGASALRAARLRSALARSGLPKPSPARATIFELVPPDASVLPSPDEAFGASFTSRSSSCRSSSARMKRGSRANRRSP